MLGDHYGEAYDPEHVADVLNDVVLEFCLKGRCCISSLSLPGASSYGVYNAAGIIDQARANGSSDRCYGFAVRVMDGDSVMFPETRVESLVGGLFGGRWLVDPVSSGMVVLGPVSGDTVTVEYVGLPEPMGVDADYPDPDVPDGLEDLFCFGVCERMLEEGSRPDDFKRSLEFSGLYSRVTASALGRASKRNGLIDDVRPL
jgi:hypothetical protein